MTGASRAGQKLALGTAQFGLNYGITNRAGQLSDETVQALLQGCRTLGWSLLDTAGGYGDSERRLGHFLKAGPPHAWQVMTKTPASRKERFDAADLERFRAAWHVSRGLFGPGSLHALLVHHADDLFAPGGEALHGWLCELRERREVAHIGVSVYDGAQIDALFDRFSGAGRPFDIVQLPANIADQRLLAGPLLDRLRDMGVQLHVRSLYLQGLLLATPEFVEKKFPGKGRWVRDFRLFCEQHGMSPVQGCMSFLKSNPVFDVAVVGVTSMLELGQLGQAYDSAPLLDWRAWADNDPLWVDPRRWTKP